MNYKFTPHGVCSRAMEIEIEDNVVKSLKVEGGCNGNLQGISALIVGMKPEDYIARCKNIKCGMKDTSCPAQLAIALEEIIRQENKEI